MFIILYSVTINKNCTHPIPRYYTSLYALEISNANYSSKIYDNICSEWLVDFAQKFEKIPHDQTL